MLPDLVHVVCSVHGGGRPSIGDLRTPHLTSAEDVKAQTAVDDWQSTNHWPLTSIANDSMPSDLDR